MDSVCDNFPNWKRREGECVRGIDGRRRTTNLSINLKGGSGRCSQSCFLQFHRDSIFHNNAVRQPSSIAMILPWRRAGAYHLFVCLSVSSLSACLSVSQLVCPWPFVCLPVYLSDCHSLNGRTHPRRITRFVRQRVEDHVYEPKTFLPFLYTWGSVYSPVFTYNMNIVYALLLLLLLSV